MPVIVIDPKGDLTNLMLTFPGSCGRKISRPGSNEDDARRAGKSATEFAADQADRWKKGLAEWGQDGARIKRLRDAADFVLYTPGSTAGRPVSVLTSFERPAGEDSELLARARSDDGVEPAGIGWSRGRAAQEPRAHPAFDDSAGRMAGRREPRHCDADPARAAAADDAHRRRWTSTRSFRHKIDSTLAMSINALIASPGFEVWNQGEPLDVAAFLRSDTGKPRVSIFTLAHLDDSQRMFFVSLC